MLGMSQKKAAFVLGISGLAASSCSDWKSARPAPLTTPIISGNWPVKACDDIDKRGSARLSSFNPLPAHHRIPSANQLFFPLPYFFSP
jgi:hypothetical protein